MKDTVEPTAVASNKETRKETEIYIDIYLQKEGQRRSVILLGLNLGGSSPIAGSVREDAQDLCGLRKFRENVAVHVLNEFLRNVYLFVPDSFCHCDCLRIYVSDIFATDVRYVYVRNGGSSQHFLSWTNKPWTDA